MTVGTSGQVDMLSSALAGFGSGRLGSPVLITPINLPLDRGDTHRTADTCIDIRITNESPCLYQNSHSPLSETLELSFLSTAGLAVDLALGTDLSFFSKLVRAAPGRLVITDGVGLDTPCLRLKATGNLSGLVVVPTPNV
jgi:hypothetical protein